MSKKSLFEKYLPLIMPIRFKCCECGNRCYYAFLEIKVDNNLHIINKPILFYCWKCLNTKSFSKENYKNALLLK